VELHPLKIGFQGVRKRFDGPRLGKTWRPLHQEVPVGQ